MNISRCLLTKCCGRIIRLSSWRERLGLSAEWVRGQYEEEFVHCFVDDIAWFMMAVLEESSE